MSRVALLEVEFINNPTIEVKLVSGPNATRACQAFVNAIAHAIFDDVRNQE